MRTQVARQSRGAFVGSARRGFALLPGAVGTFVILLSCGGEDTPTQPPAPEPSRPAQVSLDPDTVTVTAGDTVTVRSTVVDQRGRRMFSAPLTWTSSDPTVATIDEAGLVTGIREGKTSISVTAGQVSASAATFVHSMDRRTLMDLLYSAGGEDWTDSGNWGSYEPVGSWYGVEANADARVTALRLSNNALSGQLPEDLGDMVFLTELQLGENPGLSGPIPVSLSELSIAVLEYGSTMLCTVRDEGFQAWLNAVPTRDGDFIACNEERSDLMKLYDAMGGADWVNSFNWGTSQPLRNWYGIAVDSVTGRVTQINLNRNELSGEIPPEIQYFPELQLLRLDYNELEGEVPPEIGKLTELRRMDIDGNEFTGRIPPEIGNLTKLEELWMGGSSMSGPIPPEIGNLTKLEDLHLYEARFEGPLPPELGALTELRVLRIADTRVEGPLPSTLGALEELRTLSISGNRFSGPLPPEIGQLESLRVLDARENRLSGPLPPELGQLGQLRSLLLRDNMIDGPLPGELGRMERLEWISAENNMLSGPLPPGLGDSEALIWLHVQNNPDMSGPLPAELTSISTLEQLMAFETGLCAPTDPEIRDWLNDVVVKWRIPACEGDTHAEAHLIQATQSSEYPVPLVADRSALLRVFVMSDDETTETIPPVRATFFVGGAEVHRVDIPAGSSVIPTEIEMAELDLSANVEIPAEVIQPGLEMVVEVDPGGTADPALGVAKRIPADGRLAVEVMAVPPLQLTLVPLDSNDGNRAAQQFVDTASIDDDIFFETRTLLPVSTFEIRKLSSLRVDSNNIFRNLDAVETKRIMEQGTGHWMGLNANPEGGFSGVAWLGANSIPGRGKVSVSRLNAGTIAHELGHNLNLRHADCGNPANPDPTYPYHNAVVGVWGYDPRDGGSIVSPDGVFDHMSYCDPAWTSDYYFTNALRFRMADTTEIQTSAVGMTLLVSGGASADGTLHLDPAFVVETLPVAPFFGGPYQLLGRRADGTELFSASFDMNEVMDGDGRSGFVFALPAQPQWATELASLVLIGPNGSVEIREGSEPPMAVMRDPRTGEVRAILRDLPADPMAPGALDGLAPVPGLEIVVSGGLPGVAEWRR